MATENYYKGVKHTIYLSTDTGYRCEICSHEGEWNHNFAKAINHYIEKHGYKILHIGQDAKETGKGNPISDTVAVLGK